MGEPYEVPTPDWLHKPHAEWPEAAKRLWRLRAELAMRAMERECRDVRGEQAAIQDKDSGS